MNPIRALTSVLVTVLLLACVGEPRALADDEVAASQIRPAEERLVELWLIGGSVRDESRRDVGRHQIDSGGWPAFVQRRVRPAYDWGIRRFWLHNPFGTVNGVMSFSQYVEAGNAGLDFLTRDFAASWRPVVQGSFGEPTELVAYIGVANFEDGSRLQSLHEQGNVARTLAYLLRCTQPLIEAGASIGADASARLADDGPTFHYYKFLQELGTRVYVESRPRIALPAWAQFDVVAEDGWWCRSDPEKNPDMDRFMPEEDYQRSVVRIMWGYDGSSTDPTVIEPLIARIRNALLEGHTVAFRGDGLRAAGIPMSRLTDGIDDEIAARERVGDGPRLGSRARSVSSSSQVAEQTGKQGQETTSPSPEQGRPALKRRVLIQPVDRGMPDAD